MKKRKITGAAAALSAAVSLGACGIYGPAPADLTTTTTIGTTPTVTSTEATASDTFRPEDMFTQTEYGPPEWLETDETSNDEPTVFTAEDNDAECVYGPPEWFETEDTAENTEPSPAPYETTNSGDDDVIEKQEKTGSIFGHILDILSPDMETVDYSPEENIGEDVYGPPEWFE